MITINYNAESTVVSYVFFLIKLFSSFWQALKGKFYSLLKKNSSFERKHLSFLIPNKSVHFLKHFNLKIKVFKIFIFNFDRNDCGLASLDIFQQEEML